jgi:cephalosporin-C deacetylase
VDVYDVTFSGFDGQSIKAWLRVPAGTTTPLPTVVEFVGYGGGRGYPTEDATIAASGFAHFHMDTRGQGSTWSVGDTPDIVEASDPQVPGVMTKGIGSRDTYYYRRLFTDAVLAVRAAAGLEFVDEAHIGVRGGSQGGALSLAATAFNPDLVKATAVRVAFLADFPRAVMITDAYPFREIADYLNTHRLRTEEVLATLSYFDSVNTARRSRVPARFSVGLMDPITPPSTVYAAYNAYAGEKTMTEWAFNGHEAGGHLDLLGDIDFFRARL